MVKTFDSGTVRPDFAYSMLIGSILSDGRVATLGYNGDVDVASAPEDVWAGSVLGVLNGIDHRFLQFPASAVAMEVVSSSANDTAAGTGARTVVVQYLDSAYAAKSATVTMNGTTAVALPENVLRVNNVLVATAGTSPRGVNAGNISVRAAGGAGATYTYMLAGVGIAQSSLYTVPAGRALDLMDILCSAHEIDTSHRAATWALCVQNSAGRLIKGLVFGTTSTNNYVHRTGSGAPVTTIPEKFDVWMSCEAVSANNSAITGAFIGVLR